MSKETVTDSVRHHFEHGEGRDGGQPFRGLDQEGAGLGEGVDHRRAGHAAHTDKMSLLMAALAKAHGVSAEASNRAGEAMKKVGFGTQDTIHAVHRFMVADMKLPKAEGRSKVAKDDAAIANITPRESLEKLLIAIGSRREAGPGKGQAVQAIANNPRLVRMSATKSNASLQLSPGTLTGQMNRFADTLKNSASCLACTLLMARFALMTSDT